MKLNDFICLTYTPIDFHHPGLAIAAIRAGGVGILDMEFGRNKHRATANLESLLISVRENFGLRMGGKAPLHNVDLLEQLVDYPHWLIINAQGELPLTERIAQLPLSKSRKLLLEVTSIKDLSGITEHNIDGIVAKGYEAGGWVGNETSFILTQKLLQAQQLPIYVQGGIGIHNASACRAIGAAGVILDDQLLLMPESGLPIELQQHLWRIDGKETLVLGERLANPCRVLAPPTFAAAEKLKVLAGEIEVEAKSSELWRNEASQNIGWADPQKCAWPVGQAVGIAKNFKDKYFTTGRLIQALLKETQSHINIAAEKTPLAHNAPLAKSHGTQYPVVQGPMTRVSDTAEFALAVAKAGGLPFLALALMRGDQVLELLTRTKELLADRPWGVGLLGFISKGLRDTQLEAIWKIKPPFALIAGGRPDQAAAFEKKGIPTYIHAPSPELLTMFLEQGARRFVFEGRECGGHIGPLTSFVLWEMMIEVLLAKVPKGEESKIHVLFAGGVHDAGSAAMVSAMAAPLVEKGINIGVLIGSAYLFTEEIVATKSIVSGFQEQALQCQDTASLETGPGHATRCAITPFVDEFYSERRRLIKNNSSAEMVRERLEEMNLGRLRIASKGKLRNNDSKIEEVDQASQVKDGMYMIGQVATLRDKVVPIEQLHADICDGSKSILQQSQSAKINRIKKPNPSNIAIIGLGTLLPKATSHQQYWHNILAKVNAITEIPKQRWDWRLYFDADRNKRDKIYSKWGGFIDEVAFDPLSFGIPPNSLKSIDPIQLLTLEVVRRGLEDAGYTNGDYDRENTSIILGAGGGLGDVGLQYGVRSELLRFVEDPSDLVWDRLPEWTQESFAGSLLNVNSGRAANRFDLGGINLTVDAACASSLAAVSYAVNELESGRSNVVIAGGVDTVQSPFGFLCFSKTQALSPQGKVRTFDEHGDGIVISEGLAVTVLKRLEDAERDGDRIYAVIKAVSGSSDGKGLGLTAPRPEGQMRALSRAYGKAGFPPSTLGLIEAHGTGTPVGDRAEIETVVRTLKKENAKSRACAIGSVKTLVGHTKATAGIAGLVKLALSLHHKVLPAHYGVEQPFADITDPESPIYLLKEARPWFKDNDLPRRSAISAFGFGGTNFHGVLEEYQGEYRKSAAPLGAANWPVELFLFRSVDEPALLKEVEKLLNDLRTKTIPSPGVLAYSLAKRAETRSNTQAFLSIIAKDLESLTASLELFYRRLRNASAEPLPENIYYNAEVIKTGKVAFLFPGQGSQYLNMGRESALYLDEIRAAIEFGDKIAKDDLDKPLSRFIYPPSAFDPKTEKQQSHNLMDTRIAQPALGVIEMGYFDFMRRLGLSPDMTAGHSYGEYVALYSAGVISREGLLNLSITRGKVMAEACQTADEGGMAAVFLEREKVLNQIQDLDGVVIANHNAPDQSVISGPRMQVEKAVSRFIQSGAQATVLPVAGAFHTKLMESAQAPLTAAIEEAVLHSPKRLVYSNNLASTYPDEPDAIRLQLSQHLLKSVEFSSQINKMYNDEARIFVELGPKKVLSGLVQRNLAAQDHHIINVGDGLNDLLNALGLLWTLGVDFKPTKLFSDREQEGVDLFRPGEWVIREELPKTTWFVSGGAVRALGDSVLKTGKLEPLNFETLEQAKALHIAKQEQPVVSKPESVQDPIANSVPKQAPIPAISNSGSERGIQDVFQSYQETMRQFLSLQERVIGQYMGGEEVHAKPQKPAPPPAPVIPPIQVETPTLFKESEHVAVESSAQLTMESGPSQDSMATVQLAQKIVNLVSERTGYPQEMIDMDKDLEAELGVDSIKRVEILGAFQQQLPSALADVLKDRMELFTAAKTLQEIVDHIVPAMPSDKRELPVQEEPLQANSFDQAEVVKLLLELLSERTGYPQEMIGLDKDLEAELGVDSIKRVEILGAFQQRLPSALAGVLKDRMELFTAAKTLQEIVDHIAPAIPSDKRELPVQEEPLQANSFDQAEIVKLLLELLSERTGYPQEMIGLDKDLEAELGVDSIKRVEILGAFQQRLPSALAGVLKDRMELFTSAKTLQQVVDQLMRSKDAHTAGTDEPVGITDKVEDKQPTESGELARFVMQDVQKPIESFDNALIKGGVFLITEDQQSVALSLVQELTKQGAKCEIISNECLLDENCLTKRVNEIKENNKPINGILHLAPLSNQSWTADSTAWRQANDRDTKSLFLLLQLFNDDLQKAASQGKGQILSASSFGGYFGRKQQNSGSLPTAGAAAGILKCLKDEWSGLRVSIVDFCPSSDSQTRAKRIVDELSKKDNETEIGYPNGNRIVFYTQAAPRNENRDSLLKPAEDWIVLITGGARGITAEIAHEIGQPGMRFYVLGRSKEPQVEVGELCSIQDENDLRKFFIDQEKMNNSMPSPVLINKKIEALKRNREIRSNLERFRNKGVDVNYLEVDVTDAQAFGQAIDNIYSKHGRLNAVIHGAGVIEDKRFTDKSKDSFDRVYNTKVDSGFILANHLRGETLDLLVLFTSVAGRYGNAGQSDYAAANEVINRLAWRLDTQWPDARVISINWGPWDTNGMASEGVKKQFRDKGIEPINTQQGRKFMIDELLYGASKDVELIAGVGPWQYESIQTADFSIQPAFQVDGSVTWLRRFDRNSDPYLWDHQLDGIPVLPAAAVAEWMAQFVQTAWPDWCVTEICDLMVLSGFTLKNGEFRVGKFVASSSSHADAETVKVSVDLIDPETEQRHYRAVVVLKQQLAIPWEVNDCSLSKGDSLQPDAAYRDYLFHGHRFQLVKEIRNLSAQGLDAEVAQSCPYEWQKSSKNPLPDIKWIFDPGIIDTAPQLAIVWARVRYGVTALPTRIGKIVRYQPLDTNVPLNLAFRVKEKSDENILRYDAIYFDSNHQICLELRDVEGACSAVLNRLAGQFNIPEVAETH